MHKTLKRTNNEILNTMIAAGNAWVQVRNELGVETSEDELIVMLVDILKNAKMWQRGDYLRDANGERFFSECTALDAARQVMKVNAK
jgi:hypothetical protein